MSVLWGSSNGLRFNPKKTQMVLFTNLMRFPKAIIDMEGSTLELEDSFRHLGVEIHRSLSWNTYITNRVNMWGPSTSPNTGERRASKQRRKCVRFADKAFAFFPFPVEDEDELSVFYLI